MVIFVNKTQGLTLLELLVALAIVAILAVVAIPNFTDTAKRNRVTSNANSILSSLQFARTEALRRGGSVEVVPTDGSDWANGVCVFIDANDDNVCDSGEEVRVWSAFADDSSVTEGDASRTHYSFDSRGFVSNAAAFQICDDRTGETGRVVQLLISGTSWVGEFACS